MNDPMPMTFLERPRDPDADPSGSHRRELKLIIEDFAQVPSFEILQHDVGHAVARLAFRDDRNDIRVHQALGGSDFAFETGDEIGGIRCAANSARFTEHFYRDGRLRSAVVSEVHNSHRSFAQESSELVPLLKDTADVSVFGLAIQLAPMAVPVHCDGNPMYWPPHRQNLLGSMDESVPRR